METEQVTAQQRQITKEVPRKKVFLHGRSDEGIFIRFEKITHALDQSPILLHGSVNFPELRGLVKTWLTVLHVSYPDICEWQSRTTITCSHTGGGKKGIKICLRRSFLSRGPHYEMIFYHRVDFTNTLDSVFPFQPCCLGLMIKGWLVFWTMARISLSY